MSHTKHRARAAFAHCLEIHDLWISQAIAGRDKDREFCRSLREFGLVDGELLVGGWPPWTGAAVRERVDEIIRSQPPTM